MRGVIRLATSFLMVLNVTVRAERPAVSPSGAPPVPRASMPCSQPSDCDDGNDCTADDCVLNKCGYEFVSGDCDDGFACTEYDACYNGYCQGVPVNGDDHVACTIDFCDEASGSIVNLDVTAIPCDSHDDCPNGVASCGAGFCVCCACDDYPCELGCGECRLYGDIQPPYCIVEVADLLRVLIGFAEPGYPDADIAPCGSDGNLDVGDVLAALDAYSGFSICPHPCSAGACCVGPGDCCDANSPGGMSRTQCCLAGGTYLGDATACPGTCPP